MRIGKRKSSDFLERLVDVESYRSVGRFFQVYDRPVKALVSEILSLGSYPRKMGIKTPMGRQEVTLYSVADFSTLNLVFCRQDYLAPKPFETVVDIGSNIGLSSLYWLTRNPDSFVYAYEPSPFSMERLRENLKAFEGRYSAKPAAVSDFSGQAQLGIEASGVYSSLDLVSANSVTCECVHINDVLEEALTERGFIDILKVDSEGHELRSIKAIDPSFWPYIACVNTDARGCGEFIPQGFERTVVSSAERFYNKPSQPKIHSPLAQVATSS
jgi:FkbM family methyltransferase